MIASLFKETGAVVGGRLFNQFHARQFVPVGAAVALLILLTDCAGLTTKTIRTPADELDAKGFRYYETAYFLFVHRDGKGGLTGEIKPLPDTTKVRSIRPYAVWASNETTLTFTNGTLSEANAALDQTAVAGAALDALTKVLTTAAALNDIKEKSAPAPPPYLFKIVVHGDSVSLVGGSRIRKKSLSSSQTLGSLGTLQYLWSATALSRTARRRSDAALHMRKIGLERLRSAEQNVALGEHRRRRTRELIAEYERPVPRSGRRSETRPSTGRIND